MGGKTDNWNSSAIGTPGGQAWWARTHGNGPYTQAELDMNTSEGLEKLVSAGLFHGAGAGDDPLAMEKAFTALGDNSGDGSGSTDANGIDTSATGDPLWMQLGFNSKAEWRAAGKPRSMADTSADKLPSMFHTPYTPWNPNPNHPANHPFMGTGAGMPGSTATPAMGGMSNPQMSIGLPNLGFGGPGGSTSTMGMPSFGGGLDYSQRGVMSPMRTQQGVNFSNLFR